MNKILEEIGILGIIPVVALENENDAEPLAKALIDGGLPCAEITFRTSVAPNIIKMIANKFPHMLIGAGTVVNKEQIKVAIDSGAKFIVSPGFDPHLVESCLKNNITVTPGIATPSDIQVAMQFGIEVVKFFPAEASGGLSFLKALSDVFRPMWFIPTGGIDESNLLDYLRFPKVLACGSSWIVRSELAGARRFDDITLRTRKAIALMLGFDVQHIGFNTSGPSEAGTVAEQLSTMFEFDINDLPGSIFVGNQFEILKRTYLGTHGHIAIGTHFIDRAIENLKRKGISIKPDTRNEVDGKLRSVYLDLDMCGFAVHLLQL